jgi:hypothetical protein
MTKKITTTTTPKELQPTAIVREAIDMMVHFGTHRDDAAKAVGMLPKSLYKALAKPHVKRYFNAQLEVLRTAARARNFHRLEEIREQDSNPMAAVNAIKALEGLAADQEANPASAARAPGLVIVIQNGTPTPKVIGPAAIDVTPQPPPRIAHDDADPTIFRPKR